MIREFVAPVCFLLIALTLCSSGDPRIQTPHGGQNREGHDGHRSKHPKMDDHKSHSRTSVQRTHDRKSKTLSKEKDKDNVLNFERVLFDREVLKNYVLDYLRTHGFAQNPATSYKNSLDHKQKSAGRDNNHRDKLESSPSSWGEKHEHKHYRALEDENYHSRNKERDSLDRNKNRADGNSKHHSKSESLGSREHLHGRHSTHEKDNDVLYKEHTTKRSKLSSKGRRHHDQQMGGPNYVEKHHLLKKDQVPTKSHVRSAWFQRESSHHRYLETETKRDKSRKYSFYSEKHGSKRKTSVKKHHRTEHELDERPSKKTNMKSIDKSSPGTKKERVTNTDISHKNLKHYSGLDERGNQRRGKIVSETDDLSYSPKQKSDHNKKKGLNDKKSNKRDFIAVIPAQSFKLEGFDVQPVHQHKLHHDKHKRKSTKILKHVKAKKDKSEKHSVEEEGVARGRGGVTYKSRTNNHEIKSQSQEAEVKSRVTHKRSRNNHRKQSERSAQAKRKNYLPDSLEHKKISAHKQKKKSRHRDSQTKKFSPSWKSLDQRKIPSWYDDAKFGIFVHWGLYSVPSFDSEWFWYKWKGRQLQKYLNFTRMNFPPGFSYNEFAPLFTAEFFNATQWAELVARSGARYFVFTSKHHEGFTNWNSSVAWNWNSVDIGPHRNIVYELARAFRDLSNPEVKFGLYYSLFEWFNPHYLKDKANGFRTDEYIKAVMKPQLYDLVNTFKPDYLWTDGDWEANYTYWRSTEFLAWLFNESPVKDTVVVNDRWGRACRCHHGGVYTGADRYNPGKLEKRKWENAMTIDRHSWGFRRDANLKDYLSIEELIKQLVSTVSCGGNLLMNVGPASDGTISPIFQERLTQMGDWLKVNGDAIYKTRPWRAQNDSVKGDVWYTSKGKHVFATSLSWPRSGKLELGDPIATPRTRVKMLGTKTSLSWRPKHKSRKGGLVIHVPAIPVSDLPCLWAWVFKLSHVE